MKTFFRLIAISTLLVSSFAPTLVRAQDDSAPPPDDQGVSFQTFYDQLGDQGTWVQTDDYGYVFQPNVSDPDWAPYTAGHWVYTDDGWTWVSDEPWGWATCHYGRWANIDGMGWVWVPGYRWAPAWVSWRYGGGYCGWAPLPPETFVGVEFGEPGVSIGAGFHFGGDVDVSFDIGPGCYNFIRVEDMGDPDYRHHFVPRGNNFAIIDHTTNVTNINIGGNGGGGRFGNFRGVAVGGPPINEVNAHATTHIPHVTLTTSNQPGPGALHGNSLAVYAPKVNPATLNQARPANVGRTIDHPTFNRGNSITKPLDVTTTVRPPAPTPQEIQAAKTAMTHAPASAKIATGKTPVRTTLNKPLTSMSPVTESPQGTPHTQTQPGTSSFNGATHPTMEHNATTAPFTGESEKSTVTPPQNEAKPTYHPQNQNTGGGYQPSGQSPTTTYHPQNQNTGGGYQPSGQPPATTYHSQNQGGGGAYSHTMQAPPHSTHQGNGKPAANNGSTNNASGQHGR